MDLGISAILIMIFIIIYYILVQFFSILFRISGMPKNKSMFQVISLLTNSGYTTSESEIVVSNRFRRRLATACMITGYVFSVIIISLIVNLLTHLNKNQINTSFRIVLLAFIFFALFLIITNIPFIKDFFNKKIENLATKLISRKNKENIITLLDVYGKSAIAEVYLNSIPEIIKDKSLAQSNLKANYNLNVMMIKRKNRIIEVTADTIIQNKDLIVVFGEQQTIKDLFSHVEKDNSEAINVLNNNVIDLIDNYGQDAMVSIEVNNVPEILLNKTLVESGIKENYQISILTITRDERNILVNMNSIIEQYDRIVVFGPYVKIKDVFK